MITFTPEEELLIARLSVVGGWEDEEAAGLKRKIKDYFLASGVPCCCYCLLSMSAWHRMTIDIEHVLPKQRFPQYTFDLRNLNISCKRCNMDIKGVDIRFFLGSPDEPNPFRSELYSLVHPNLDQANKHLMLISVQLGNNQLIKYVIRAPKGQYAYEYFDLKEIEANSFSNAQGVDIESISESLPPEIVSELRQVLSAVERP